MTARAGSKYAVQTTFDIHRGRKATILAIRDRWSVYSYCIESRDMKDKYRAERPDRFEVASIEQAKAEQYNATCIC